MTIHEFLQNATATLQQAGIQSARLDTLVLLEDALGSDRAILLAHPERKIPKSTEVELNNKIVQRSNHIPLAYIREKATFYGRDFTINAGVLVPRPETESIVELLKTATFGLSPDIIPLRMADVGTGSGCLGITAALEFPGASLDLYDVDALVLGLAVRNAHTHRLRVAPYHEDLLTQAKFRRYDVVLANLPYVPINHPINQAARHEPKLAIFGGKDGLDLYRRFWDDITTLQWQPTHIFTESLVSQHKALQSLAMAAGYKLTRTKDLAQEFRLLSN